MIASARGIAALTGAGVSVESGIPDFRGARGLWRKYDPMEYAHIDALLSDPDKVWKMLVEMDRLISSAKPNPAHYALSRLESLVSFQAVITQNVDNLHQEAGSKRVIEFHGNSARMRCMGCEGVFSRERVKLLRIPPMCECGGLIRPDVVFFGEPIPMQAYVEACAEAESCDVMLVIGTSATVAPASEIPRLAKRSGAKVVEINPEATHLTSEISDLSIHDSASVVLPAVVEALEGVR